MGELIICISWEGKGYIFCVGSTNDISSPRFAQQMMERNKKDHPDHLNSSFSDSNTEINNYQQMSETFLPPKEQFASFLKRKL